MPPNVLIARIGGVRIQRTPRKHEAVLLIHGVERATEVVEGLLREAKSRQQRVDALTAQANTWLIAAEHSAGIAAAREAMSWRQNGFAVATVRSRAIACGRSVAERTRHRGTAADRAVSRTGRARRSFEQRMKFWSDYAYVLNRRGAYAVPLKHGASHRECTHRGRFGVKAT